MPSHVAGCLSDHVTLLGFSFRLSALMSSFLQAAGYEINNNIIINPNAEAIHVSIQLNFLFIIFVYSVVITMVSFICTQMLQLTGTATVRKLILG